MDGDLEPPLKSSVQVVSADDARLVIHIPPGGQNSKFLGFFALLWNGFMCVFTPPWYKREWVSTVVFSVTVAVAVGLILRKLEPKKKR